MKATSESLKCPTVTSGWTMGTQTGMTNITQCTQTLSASAAGCYSGTLTQPILPYATMIESAQWNPNNPNVNGYEQYVSVKNASWYGSTSAVTTTLKAGKGKYLSGTGASQKCVSCTNYQYQGTNGSTATSCTPVTSGYYATGCGTSGTGCTGQTQCSGYYYCSGGQRMTCPSYYRDATGTGWTSSSQCKAVVESGYYIASAGGDPEICPSDKPKIEEHTVEYGATSADKGMVCSACPAGKSYVYHSGEKKYDCYTCPKNSTLQGINCVCNSGFTSNTGGEGGVQYVKPVENGGSCTGYTVNITLNSNGGTLADADFRMRVIYGEKLQVSWDAGGSWEDWSNVGGAGIDTYGSAIATKSGSRFAGFELNVVTGTAPLIIDANGFTTSNFSLTQSMGDYSLKAKWEVCKTTISYDLNGGTGTTPSSQTLTYGTALTLNSGSGLSRAGYTLSGWNTQANGKGTSYSKSQSISSWNGTCGNGTPTSVKLYAQWTPNTIKVTLNNQGATTAGTKEYYYQYNTKGTCYYYTTSALTTCIGGNSGDTITKPTKTGYTFGGYYTGQNGSGTQYVKADGVTTNNLYTVSTSNITLYAKWNPIQATITLDKNDGTGGTTTLYRKYNTNVSISSTSSAAGNLITASAKPYNFSLPSRNLHEFMGYYTAETGGTQVITAVGRLTSDTALLTLYPTSTTFTLYAHWKYVGVQCPTGYYAPDGATSDMDCQIDCDPGYGVFIPGDTCIPLTAVPNMPYYLDAHTVKLGQISNYTVCPTISDYDTQIYSFDGNNMGLHAGLNTCYLDMSGVEHYTDNIIENASIYAIGIEFYEWAEISEIEVYVGDTKLDPDTMYSISGFAEYYWDLFDGDVTTSLSTDDFNYFIDLDLPSGLEYTRIVLRPSQYMAISHTQAIMSIYVNDSLNSSIVASYVPFNAIENGTNGEYNYSDMAYDSAETDYWGTREFASVGFSFPLVAYELMFCQPGTYLPEYRYYAGGPHPTCNPASAGHYAAGEGNSQETPCPAGKYQDATGQTACKNTNSGYYVTGCNSDNEACTSQTKCTGATYCSGGVQENCPTGYVDDLSERKTAASQCKILVPGGKYLRTKYSTNTAPCVAGSYKAEHLVGYGQVETQESCIVCGINQYSDSGAAACETCPSGYVNSGNTSLYHAYAYSCKTTCSAGQRVTTPGATCSSPAGNWFYGESQEVSYGNVSAVNYCMDGYTASGTTAADHDAATDCKTTVPAGQAVNKNTITARYVRFASDGYLYGSGSESDMDPSIYLNEIQAFTSNNATGTNLLDGLLAFGIPDINGEEAYEVGYGATDGYFDVSDTYISFEQGQQGSILFDMGANQEIGSFVFSVDYGYRETYKNVQIFVATADEPNNWIPVMQPTDIETSDSYIDQIIINTVVVSDIPRSCAANTYRAGNTALALTSTLTCSSCPTAYPNSDVGTSDEKYCYVSKTKTGAQLNPDIPDRCSNATYNACTPGSCTYRDYNGATDETCTASSCTKTIASVTATAGNYVSGTSSCDVCPAPYSNSAAGNTGGVSACYLNTTPGKYIADKEDKDETECPTGEYCPSEKVNYGSANGGFSCDKETEGNYPFSELGSDSIRDCYVNVHAGGAVLTPMAAPVNLDTIGNNLVASAWTDEHSVYYQSVSPMNFCSTINNVAGDKTMTNGLIGNFAPTPNMPHDSSQHACIAPITPSGGIYQSRPVRYPIPGRIEVFADTSSFIEIAEIRFYFLELADALDAGSFEISTTQLPAEMVDRFMTILDADGHVVPTMSLLDGDVIDAVWLESGDRIRIDIDSGGLYGAIRNNTDIKDPALSHIEIIPVTEKDSREARIRVMVEDAAETARSLIRTGEQTGEAGDNMPVLGATFRFPLYVTAPKACGAGTYKESDRQYFANTLETCDSCPAPVDGWKYDTATGLGSWAECKMVTTTSTSGTPLSSCSAGALSATALDSTHWKDPTVSTALKAKSNNYVNGTRCSACSGLAGGFYPNSAADNTGGASACYTNTISGAYIATANASSTTSCASGTFKGDHTVNYGSTSSCSVCGDNQYSVTGATSCTACPSEYGNSGDTATAHAGESSCKTTCSAGQRVVSAGEQCTSPAGNWFTSAAQDVNYGSISAVDYCMTGYTSNGTTASAHDAARDCTTTISGQYIEQNTIPASKIKIVGIPSGTTLNFMLNEIQAFESHDGTGTNILAGKNCSVGANCAGATDGNFSMPAGQKPTASADGEFVFELGGSYEIGSIMFNTLTPIFDSLGIYVLGGMYGDWIPVFYEENYTKVGVSTPTMVVLNGESIDCDSGTYQGTTTVVLGDTSTCSSCPAAGDGWYYDGPDGLTDVTQCTAMTDVSYGGTPLGNCSAGKLTKTAKDSTSWNDPTVTTALTAKANNYVNGQTCDACPSGYPNSVVGNTGGVTACFSNTKQRPWTGSQLDGAIPTNCSAVTDWNACSVAACDYTAYANSAGTGDGTVKSGCETNAESCTKTVKAVSAQAGFYDAGTTCTACPSGYPNSVVGNTGGASACYTNTISGAYIAKPNDATSTQCAAGTFKGNHSVHYGDTSTCDTCTAGNYCVAGSSAETSCSTLGSFYTKSLAGAKTDTACYGTTTSKKYIQTVGDQTESDCAANGYCTGGIDVHYGSVGGRTACSTLGGGLYKNSPAKSDEAEDCYTDEISGAYLGKSTDTSTTECAGGTYLGKHTLNYPQTSTCSTCVAGNYCPAGSTVQTACSKLGGGLYSHSASGATQDTDCYAKVVAGHYIQTKADEVQTTCSGTYYCPGGTLYWDNVGGNEKCPDAESHKRVTYPEKYHNPTLVFVENKSDLTGLTKITECAVTYEFTNKYGQFLVDGTTYNSSNGKYDIGGDLFYDTLNPGYYFTERLSATWCDDIVNNPKRAMLYSDAAACPKDHYCSGLDAMPLCSSGTYNATLGQTSCVNPYPNSDGGTSATSVNACYLSTTAGKYVETAGAGLTDCVAGGYCAGGTKIYADKTGGITVCASNTYSDAGASACTACDTEDGYGNSGNEYSQHAGIKSCVVSCPAGSYVETAGGKCINVGAGFWGTGGDVAQTETSKRHACTTGLTTIGYGYGANEADDCGRKLHAGGSTIFLRSGKRTAPAFHANVGGLTLYGNMSETNRKAFMTDPERISAWINASNAWVESSDSYSVVYPVEVGKKYTLTFDTTSSSVVGTIFRWGFTDNPSPASQQLQGVVRTSPQSTPSATIEAVAPYLVVQIGAGAAESTLANHLFIEEETLRVKYNNKEYSVVDDWM